LEELNEDEQVPGILGDRYVIVRPLGHGGRSRLFLARHLHLEELCAVKLFRLASVNSADEFSDDRVQLRNEARSGFRVSHPNVARVFDLDSGDGCWYFVMEYVRGIDLEQVIGKQERLPWRQVAELGRQISEGLAAIHRTGLVHRDIKPGNIMLTSENRAKILDLGLAAFLSDLTEDSEASPALFAGTPQYMAPEQLVRSRQATFRSDLYSLGATLYHLLTGRPHRRETDIIKLRKYPYSGRIEWPLDVSVEIPRWLMHSVDMCLADDVGRRFRTAEELAQALTVPATSDNYGELTPPANLSKSSRGIGVYPFENGTQNPSHDWMGQAIAQQIEIRLMEIAGAHVIDGKQLISFLERKGFSGDKTPPQDELVNAAGQMGAQSVICGTFMLQGEKLWMGAKAFHGHQDTPQFLARHECSEEESLTGREALATKILHALGANETASLEDSSASLGTRSLNANEQFILGRREFVNGQYEKALEYGRVALRIDPEYTEPLGLIGACFSRLGKYGEGIEYHARQQFLARQRGDRYRLAESISNIGVMYYYMGEYPLALECMKRAKDLLTQMKLLPLLAKNYSNMGFAQVKMGLLGEAEESFAAAIKITREVGDLVSMIFPYNGAGNVALHIGEFEDASAYYRRALRLSMEIGDKVNIGVSHVNVGRCACLLDNLDEAYSELCSGIEILETTSYWHALASAWLYFAEWHIMKRQYVKARTYNRLALQSATEKGNRRGQEDALAQLVRIHDLTGDQPATVATLKRINKLRGVGQRVSEMDSLLDELRSRNSLQPRRIAVEK
jgi:serine/threonine protein kinase/tetratricopeptide (TPR) repeat protein